jgi:hypothetical protein
MVLQHNFGNTTPFKTVLLSTLFIYKQSFYYRYETVIPGGPTLR